MVQTKSKCWYWGRLKCCELKFIFNYWEKYSKIVRFPLKLSTTVECPSYECFILFQTVVSRVRLPLMNLEQLLKVVRPCKILEPDRLLDAIEEKTTSKNLLYRGALCKLNPFNPQSRYRLMESYSFQGLKKMSLQQSSIQKLSAVNYVRHS